jgi:hypothetical protein
MVESCAVTLVERKNKIRMERGKHFFNDSIEVLSG